MKINLTVDKNLYKQLRGISKRQNYLSLQEYIRDILRNHMQHPDIAKVGKDIEKRLKPLVS